MDEDDPFSPARSPSESVPRRRMEEGEATDQLVAGILDWAETTVHDRDDLDRWLRHLVTGRDPAGICHGALGSAGRGSLGVNPAVDHVDPGEYSRRTRWGSCDDVERQWAGRHHRSARVAGRGEGSASSSVCWRSLIVGR